MLHWCADLSSSSSMNFTDYAASQRGPADLLRGATSYPVQMSGSHHVDYPDTTSSDGQASELAQSELSPGQLDRHAQLMTRSQSLALPANLGLEASMRSASNRHSYKRADIVGQPQKQLSWKKFSDDNSGSAMLRAHLQQQQNQQLQLPQGDKPGQKRGITKDQSMEPSKAVWADQSTLKNPGMYRSLDTPRGGSGLIKVGVGQGFQEDSRKGS